MKAFEFSSLKFLFGSKYKEYNYAWYIFVALTMSHTKMSKQNSWAYALPLILAWCKWGPKLRLHQMNIQHVNFCIPMVFKSSFLFTTKDLHSINTLLTRDNIRIHPTLKFQSSLFPFVSNSCVKLHCWKCLLVEMKKIVSCLQ